MDFGVNMHRVIAMQAIERGNRFDLLRLMAALAVFVAHGDFLYRLHLPVPFPGHSLGSVAVYVFFFVSGYLVCQSWDREPDWRAFGVKRAMRIFPGLMVAVLFSVFVLGWAVTTLPSSVYWGSGSTWLNVVNNALGLATVQTLPGVFESNPFARAVNGSLWTIRYELAMYLILATMAMAARGRRWVYPLAVCILVLGWEAARQGRWDAGIEAGGGLLADAFRWRDFCGFGVPFFVGAWWAAYGVRPRVWMALAALVSAVAALTLQSEWLRQISVWALVACGTFYAAHAGTAREGPRQRERTDISYGVYIYAFPVQQAVTAVCLRQGWPLSACLALSLLPVLGLALMSWFWVERPCIRAAHRWLRARRATRPMPSTSS
ncbi:acyltransferase [Acidovorax sp. Leaf78]|uniref:acyltransferase family protein n=1 Tax=unclassified Acidovorax TaxID=2684926 RepID=UPI000AE625EF|nr:acyltransferase [Acidovorax sp. Leaf78]